MKKQVSNFLIFFFFSLIYLKSLSAQTYISPSIGLSLSHIEGYDKNYTTEIITEPGFNKKNILWGFRIDQILSKIFFLSANFNFTNKKTKLNDRGIVGYTNLSYQQINNIVTLNISPTNNWHFGFGVCSSNLRKFHSWNDNLDDYYSPDNIQHLGWVVSSGYRHKNFLLALHYLQSQPFRNIKEEYVKSFKSIDLSLNYQFQILNKKNNKRSRVK
ncbi:MAG: hypothetical protein RLZZ292_1744 [Bacteroidota bacterium]|jgi:hypothetical protein